MVTMSCIANLTVMMLDQVTGHGYGHATRVVEVCRQALALGHEVIVCTCAPPFIFTRELDGVKVSEPRSRVA